MRKILIVGATSAIAEATARIFAARGDALFLVGRNAQHLQAIAADLGVRGAPRVATATLDVTDFGAQAAVLEQAERALGGLDIALIAHGTSVAVGRAATASRPCSWMRLPPPLWHSACCPARRTLR